MRTAPDLALGGAEAARLFQPLASLPAVGLCVSGGPDSLALLHLAAVWLQSLAKPPRAEVFTVDHGLRPSAAGEAAEVARHAAAYGLPAHILSWRGQPATGIEEAAREARYRLLAEAAAGRGIGDLVLAHHLDDQAETVLMRLARGSAAYGLAAMRSRSVMRSVALHRPFLGIPKARLVATTLAAGLVAADDESNRDGRFLRARLRRLMPELAREGLTAERLAGFAGHMARVADALDHYVDRLMEAGVSRGEQGEWVLRLEVFSAAPLEIRLRLLSRLLQQVGGRAWPARSEAVERLEAALAGQGPFKRTLAGTLVRKSRETASFAAEPGRAKARERRAGTAAAKPVHLPVGAGA